jgi:RNA polymerase sigma-70 factor, ECF subfamily
MNVMDVFIDRDLNRDEGAVPGAIGLGEVERAGAEAQKVTFTAEDRAFVTAVARRIVGDEDAAADVTQDALLLAFRYRDSFRGTSRYRTWLYRIAATTALSHLRRRRRRRADQTVSMSNLEGGELDLPALGPDPFTLVASAEAAAQVRHHLARLDPRYREVLVRRFEDGGSEDEVATALGLSVANVKIRTYRARHALRAALAA